MPRTAIYHEGYAAFDVGAALASNPHPARSLPWRQWRDGWTTARDELNDREAETWGLDTNAEILFEIGRGIYRNLSE